MTEAATIAPATQEWIDAAQRVVEAARAYADHSHANLTGEQYRARVDAHDVLLDALEALEDVRP